VLFLGLEDDLDHADAARGLVNGLLRRGVEGRLAVPAVPEGLLLAVPAAPTRATVEALRPEVVVVLDAEAAEAADRWTAGMRGTVVVELTRDIALGVELVSWRIGVAQGRLRARIGPRTGPRQLAELVNRLVAGPQPEPPDDREPAPGGAPVALAPRRSRARRPRRRAVVVHPVEGPTRRSSGLAAHLGANGWQVDAGPPAAVVAGAARADLVVGDAVSLPVLLTRLGRSRPGRVVTDLSAADLHGGTDAPVPGEAIAPDVPSLGAAALGAVGLTDAALAPSAVLVDAARRTGARALWVPDLYPADVLERYATARRHADRTGDPVIGWVVGGHQPSPAVVDALARAVIGLLAQQVRVDLFVTGSASRPDEGPLGEQFAALAAHPAVRVRPGRPDPDTLASWWGQLWAPGPTVVARTGDTSVLVEAAAAGVPSVAPATSVGPARGLLDVSALVDEPTRAGAWHAAVRPLLAASTRDGRRSQAHDRVVALHGRVAGASVVRRLTGWLDQAAVRS
jgi:hypothetical protein